MIIGSGIRSLRDTPKTVQVQLTQERREFRLTEVLGHDFTGKDLGLSYDKRSTMW
jgi:hypothetical protein